MIRQSLSNINETCYSVQIVKIYNLNKALALVLSVDLMALVKNMAMYRTNTEPISGAHDIKKTQPN